MQRGRESARGACVWVAGLFVLAAMAGCEERSVTSSTPPVTVARTPDVTERTGQGVSNLYGPGNAYVRPAVEEFAGRKAVAAVVERFEERGLELAREDCFVIEEQRAQRVVRAAILVMTPAREGVEETAMIACIETDGELIVAPATFRSSPGDRSATFERVGETLWMNAEPFAEVQRSAAEAARLSPEYWQKFWNCLEITVPTFMAGCMVTCAFAVGGYPQCVVLCVSTQALASVTRCLVSVLMRQHQEERDIVE